MLEIMMGIRDVQELGEHGAVLPARSSDKKRGNAGTTANSTGQRRNLGTCLVVLQSTREVAYCSSCRKSAAAITSGLAVFFGESMVE